MANEPMNINEEQVAFYHEIGRAVTEWAHVEISLCFVFRACFDEKQVKTAGNAFFAVENFRSKLALVEAAMASAFPDSPHLATWRTLAAQAQRNAALRNRIAHGIVVIYPTSNPGKRLIITSWNADTPKRSILPAGALGIKDVYTAARHFTLLSNRLLNLASVLIGRQEPYGAEFLQEPRSLQLQQLMRRIHLMLGPRRGPSRPKPQPE